MSNLPESVECRLTHVLMVVTEWDRKQSTRKHYNPNAMAMYCEAVQGMREDLESGQVFRAALRNRFCGALLRKLGAKLEVSPPYASWE